MGRMSVVSTVVLLSAAWLGLAASPAPAPQPQLDQVPGCPRMTEEEVKRRYPPLRVKPGEVYVVGSVYKPGAFPHKEGMTLSQAIKLAGGLLPDVNRRARLLRVRVGESEGSAVGVDLDGVGKGEVPDPVLEWGHVIEVGSKCPTPAPRPRHPYPEADPPLPVKGPPGLREVRTSGAPNNGMHPTADTRRL